METRMKRYPMKTFIFFNPTNFFFFNQLSKLQSGQPQWHVPANWEPEAGRSKVQDQPGKLSLKIKFKKGLGEQLCGNRTCLACIRPQAQYLVPPNKQTNKKLLSSLPRSVTVPHLLLDLVQIPNTLGEKRQPENVLFACVLTGRCISLSNFLVNVSCLIK